MAVCDTLDSSISQLQDWYASPLGREVSGVENSCVRSMLGDTFGYYLLQLGVTREFRDTISATRLRHRIAMAPRHPVENPQAGVIGCLAQLPFAPDSVDAVFLPHTLDFCADPRRVLREVERVLIPEGRVLILGFNALSPWGARALFCRTHAPAPWCGRFRASFQIEDWLSVLGFTLEMREYLLFRFPSSYAMGSRGTRFESWGRRFWPVLGGVYAIRAVKRVPTLTPLRPSWRPVSSLLPASPVEPKPTTRREVDHV